MIKKNNMRKFKIGIIGLGYVGLPLANEFAKKYETYGFDIKKIEWMKLIIALIVHWKLALNH